MLKTNWEKIDFFEYFDTIMILGIDLGTSNTLTAVYIDGEVKLLKNDSGSYNYPLVINISENNVIYIREEALMRKKIAF